MSSPGTLCSCAAHRGQMLRRAQTGPPLSFEVPREPDLMGNQSSGFCGVSTISKQAAARSRCQTPTLRQLPGAAGAVGLVLPRAPVPLRWVGTPLLSPCCHHPCVMPSRPIWSPCHPAPAPGLLLAPTKRRLLWFCKLHPSLNPLPAPLDLYGDGGPGPGPLFLPDTGILPHVRAAGEGVCDRGGAGVTAASAGAAARGPPPPLPFEALTSLSSPKGAPAVWA